MRTWRSPIGPGCVKSRRRLIAIEQLFVQGAFGAHTTSPFNFEIEPENIILVAPLSERSGNQGTGRFGQFGRK